jgi:hypothetical protein
VAASAAAAPPEPATGRCVRCAAPLWPKTAAAASSATAAAAADAATTPAGCGTCSRASSEELPGSALAPLLAALADLDAAGGEAVGAVSAAAGTAPPPPPPSADLLADYLADAPAVLSRLARDAAAARVSRRLPALERHTAAARAALAVFEAEAAARLKAADSAGLPRSSLSPDAQAAALRLPASASRPPSRER